MGDIKNGFVSFYNSHHGLGNFQFPNKLHVVGQVWSDHLARWFEWICSFNSFLLGWTKFINVRELRISSSDITYIHIYVHVSIYLYLLGHRTHSLLLWSLIHLLFLFYKYALRFASVIWNFFSWQQLPSRRVILPIGNSMQWKSSSLLFSRFLSWLTRANILTTWWLWWEERTIKLVLLTIWAPRTCHIQLELRLTILKIWFLVLIPSFSIFYFCKSLHLFFFSDIRVLAAIDGCILASTSWITLQHQLTSLSHITIRWATSKHDFGIVSSVDMDPTAMLRGTPPVVTSVSQENNAPVSPQISMCLLTWFAGACTLANEQFWCLCKQGSGMINYWHESRTKILSPSRKPWQIYLSLSWTICLPRWVANSSQRLH